MAPSKAPNRSPHWLIASAIALSLSLSHGTAEAGPWTPERGHGYFKAWIKYLPGWWYVDGNGQRNDYGSYHELFVNAYAEIGVFRGFALSINAPLVQTFFLQDTRAAGQPINAYVGPGDPTFGARFELARAGRAILSVEGSVRVPLATGAAVAPVYSSLGPDYRQLGELRIGNGAADVGIRFWGGYSTSNFYVAASNGVIYRSNGFDPVVVFSGEMGGRVARNRVGLRVRAQGYLSLPWGSAQRAESPSGMGNGTRYTGLALEADYRLVNHWDLGITLESGLGIQQRQTGGPVISLSIATTF